MLDQEDEFKDAKLVIALPEHQVALDGGGHHSQTDLWALLDAPVGMVSVSVEAKAGESFDKLVDEWLSDSSPDSGKPARLQQLLNILALTEDQAKLCRYQLLHRSAAAILEAKRFHADHAMLLVQSFKTDPGSVADYNCFAQQLGLDAPGERVAGVGLRSGVQLWLAWVNTPVASDFEVASTV